MDRREKYRGCLLAGAIGDALGGQVEFMPLPFIRAAHGENGVRDLSTIITDDTQMTLFTAEGMLLGREYGMPMPACVYQAYLDWLHTQEKHCRGGFFRKQNTLLRHGALHHRRAPGNTCLGALESGRMGEIGEPLNSSKGCGGVMRTAPCGLLSMGEGEECYAMQGAMAAAVTHGHIMGYVPAAMLADLVHRIVTGDERPFPAIVRDSLTRMMAMFGGSVTPAEGCESGSAGGGSFVAMLQFRELIGRALHAAETDAPCPETIESLGGGWVGDEALAIAVYCVAKFPHDMEECLSAAVTHGGDSDSTGAIAGNLIGAMLGTAGIPEKWRHGVELWDVIEGMADRLYEAETERKE